MKKLFALLLAPLLLCGCLASDDSLDAIGVIKGLAFDAGEENAVELTACVAVSDTEKGVFCCTSAAQTPAAALSLLEKSCERKPFLGQNELVVVSEAYAQSGLASLVSVFSVADSRAEQLLVLRGRASDAFSISEYSEQTVPSSLLRRLSTASHYLPRMSVSSLRGASLGVSGSAVVPIGSVEDGAFSLDGLAVFRDFKMIGTLCDAEVSGANWLTGDPSGLILPSENPSLSFTVKRYTRQVFAENENPLSLQAQLTVLLSCDNLEEISSAELSAPARQIYAEIQAAFSAAQRMKADFLGLAAAALNPSPEALSQYTDCWNESLADASLSLSVECRLILRGVPISSVWPEA